MLNNVDTLQVIGLTGNTGSGKSCVSEMLARRGGYIIDADSVAHEALDACAEEVIAEFSRDILDAEGKIARRKLGAIVFSDTVKKKALERITHKYVTDEIISEIDKIKNLTHTYNFIVIDAPLLLEAGLHEKVSMSVWVVYADRKIRLSRIMSRDSLSQADAEARMNSQNSFEWHKKFADVIIQNSGGLEELEQEIEKNLQMRNLKINF